MIKSNYGRPIKLEQRFEMFLIDHYAGDIWDKSIPGM